MVDNNITSQCSDTPDLVSMTEWEKKKCDDFDIEVRKTWDNDHIYCLVELCKRSMDKVAYWLGGNLLFRQFYRVKKGDLIWHFDQVLQHLGTVLENKQPSLHHKDKTCKCWDWITQHMKWVYEIDDEIQKCIRRDSQKHPTQCWFIQTTLRYKEWREYHEWFYKSVTSKKRYKKPLKRL